MVGWKNQTNLTPLSKYQNWEGGDCICPCDLRNHMSPLEYQVKKGYYMSAMPILWDPDVPGS